MRRSKDRKWLKLTLGGAACLVGGVVLGALIQIGKDHKWSRNRELKDLNEQSSRKYDAATIIRRLRKAEWNRDFTEFLGRLDFENASDAQLRMLAGELETAFEKDILSMKTICERFHTAKAVVLLLSKTIVVYQLALSLLKTFTWEVLEMDSDRYILSAIAQSNAHCMCFVSSHSSCAEVVSALAVNYPTRLRVYERLGDALQKSRGWNRKQIEFVVTMASPILEFEELAVKALNEAFARKKTKWKKITGTIKLLQDSEKLFWDSIMTKSESTPEFTRIQGHKTNRLSVCSTPEIMDGLTNIKLPVVRAMFRGHSLNSNLLNKNTRSPRGSLNIPNNRLVKRRPTRRKIVSSERFHERVASMSAEEIDSEIEQMEKAMKSMSTSLHSD